MYMGLFSSCANKNMQASKQSKTNTSQEKAAVTKNKQGISILDIEETFKKQHVRATDIVWAKDSMLNKDTNHSKTHQLNYTEDGKKNTIIYGIDGKVVEERHQILIDQLSQPAYNAIKEGYPECKIVEAYIYRNTNKEGSYYVITKNITDLKKEQVVLLIREDGTFVQ
jgi:predicted membrane-bound dolichyl-phosphate-mannose-protein mannosyltransferase